MGWRKPPNTNVASRRDAVTTGVILARLEAAVDRLEAVYEQWAAAALERPDVKESDDRGRT